MLTRLGLKNWKSFAEAELYIDPLTVLIGTNAGGKSNALDALEFLNRTSAGLGLTACLAGDGTLEPLRGGTEWAAKDQKDRFSLSVTIRSDETTDFEYRLEAVISENRCEVASEELIRRKYRLKKRNERTLAGTIHLFRTDPATSHDPSLKARVYNKKAGSLRQLSRASSALSQLGVQSTRQEVSEGIRAMQSALQGIYILDPIPSHMRDYAALSDDLEPDAGNLAGVIAALPDTRRKQVEDTFTRYLSRLPERDIQRVYTERVGKFQSDAMLYCEEQWLSQGVPMTVDARGMSDGTLRFLAILTALLTRPEGTLLVVEEVDNGLHPSRAYLLLEMLSKIGEERRIDILVTTHNPALLDALGPEAVPFITVAHRNPETGSSELTLLENVDNLARVLGHGPLGTLSTKGVIERALKGEQLSFGFDD
ncbi:AAA family ATPase [Roseovarius pacificus]|uniref:AAA family ATPase n=1 Tax=Roseovarius pacificus TaxID=337701 RepID=UPI004039E38B